MELNLRQKTTRDSIQQQILSFCALMKVNLPAETIEIIKLQKKDSSMLNVEQFSRLLVV